MKRGYVVVEGHGERDAVVNLVTRLWSDLGLEGALVWATPLRLRGLTSERGVRDAVRIVRAKGDATCLLILRDEDDGCAKESGPTLSRCAADELPPFPVAVVLACREYESLFLASLPSIAGHPIRGTAGVLRPGIAAGSAFEGDPESVRGAKEWLTKRMPPGRAYKPAVDQVALTRMVDFDLVRASGLSWFGTLERALRFFSEGRGGTYPTPAPRTAGAGV